MTAEPQRFAEETAELPSVLPINPPKPIYPIDSVDHVLRLLVLLRAQPTVRVAGVARELGVANSTAHRLLAMLVYHGFVIKDETSHSYRSGPTLVNVGLAALINFDIRSKARPYLERLVAETSETTSLMILEGPTVRFMDAIESPCVVRVGSRAGAVMPAHITSGGMAILAALADDAVLQMFASENLTNIADGRTVQTPSALLSELADVRKAGYAVTSTACDIGLTSVGVAVCDHRGHPLAALNVAGPSSRMAGERVAEIAGHLCQAAADMQASLLE